jgi:hypothetical protein
MIPKRKISPFPYNLILSGIAIRAIDLNGYWFADSSAWPPPSAAAMQSGRESNDANVIARTISLRLHKTPHLEKSMTHYRLL